jgi:dUTPase
MKLRFKRLSEHDLPIPSRGSEFAAGLDLRAAEAHTIDAGERQLIKTGFAVELPVGFLKHMDCR